MPFLPTSIQKHTECLKKKHDIRKGFKITFTPEKPDILRYETKTYRTIADENSRKVILITLGPPKLLTVDPKCLDFIRKLLQELYSNHPLITNQLKNALPHNTIAVSFAMDNFTVKDTPQHFIPDCFAGNKAIIYYQMLSANVQACYLSVDKVEFLKGLTYYPVILGKSKCLKNDRFLIWSSFYSAEPFPLQDRNKSWKKVTLNLYGRQCGKAMKRVLVDCSDTYVQHVEYDHRIQQKYLKFCAECLVDSMKYKWAEKEESGFKRNSTTIRRRSRSTPSVPKPVAPKVVAKSSEDHLIERIYSVAGLHLGPEQPTILVFNRTTGHLLNSSQWPKLSELSNFLDTNPECNVHLNSALLAQISLGEEYKDRIGGVTVTQQKAELEDLIDILGDRGVSSTSSNLELSTKQPVELSEARLEELGLKDLKFDFDAIPVTSADADVELLESGMINLTIEPGSSKSILYERLSPSCSSFSPSSTSFPPQESVYQDHGEKEPSVPSV
ncbi:hypothetical protein CAEBREN_02818 [Caenorhabditis brenneri]|uniref:BRK domain-containing protein n=1 Tax=Caenorhabditis brenneri TaxID=135651 RepID=G0NFN0_CAEBE|nr:hypothetical protein CAEBREN_02818 [Caenorhabditis brenneri]